MGTSVYIDGRTLNRVEESMTDLLLCELLGVEPEFLTAAVARFGFEMNAAVLSVQHSVHESSLGETDIEVVVGGDSFKAGILIENKIRAPIMPRQFERYRLRGDEGVARGMWDGYLVIFAAPQSYIDRLSAEDASFLDGTLPYEWIIGWLQAQDPQRHSFKIYVLAEAIRDARAGYKKKRDVRMTAFHQGVHAIASTEFPELRMAWPEQAGYDDSIIHLPDALPARGDKLLLKAKMGKAEMRIASYDPIATERVLSATINPNWQTSAAKSYAGVEVACTPLDPTIDFSENAPRVRQYLEALRELKAFYHRDDVARSVFASRGSR